eukprot:TRINITY_DN2283_c0_g1_i4.p1 TRINITY_DN2283_c0_g1~~TRINITY_DN2283_c0_g1_i4.p1  ORF type:complete len:454 (+),score=98.83 TRINITY_DN2283_c0_g1_i4:648-2009(+)
MDGNKKLKIADFGMAAVMINEQLLGTSCGSPHYAAPEVVMGLKYDGRVSDIWSCGVVLFALVTGKLPFDDSNIRVLLKKVRDGVFHMPQHLPKDVKDLIQRMLCVQPAHRITIQGIKSHPWFKSNGQDATFPLYPPLKDHSGPLKYNEIDNELVATLESLAIGQKQDMEYRLSSQEPNQVRGYYRILQYRKDHPSCNYENYSARSSLIRQRSMSFGETEVLSPKPTVKEKLPVRDRSCSTNEQGISLPRVSLPSSPLASSTVCPGSPLSPRTCRTIVLPHITTTSCAGAASTAAVSPGPPAANGAASPAPTQPTTPSSPLNHRRPTSPISFRSRSSSTSRDQSSSPLLGTSPAKKSLWSVFTNSRITMTSLRPLAELRAELQRGMTGSGIEWVSLSETRYKGRLPTLEGPSVQFVIEITHKGQGVFSVDVLHTAGEFTVFGTICEMLQRDLRL